MPVPDVEDTEEREMVSVSVKVDVEPVRDALLALPEEEEELDAVTGDDDVPPVPDGVEMVFPVPDEIKEVLIPAPPVLKEIDGV